MKNYQILAPAGSIEQLKAAVNNGCDAVYLGLDAFNARMKAPNFTRENVGEWVRYCHLRNVKVYVTINTSIKNDEFTMAVDTLIAAYNAFADGVIVTDLALLRYAASLPKPFEVVASTQLSCHDSFGARFLKQLGASTVVCARECSYNDIEDIASVGMNVESFLHGALCVCQSGQCLFSSIVGGNSGNRGLCAQPCRKRYKATYNGKAIAEGYLLSARDMCGLTIAKRLLKSGATTFKIEGRNRKPEYAGITSRVFSELFKNDFKPKPSDMANLSDAFNRHMAPISYLTGDNSDIIYRYCQNNSGTIVGSITKCGFVAEVQVNKGDGLKIFDGECEVCGGLITQGGIATNTKAEFFGKVSAGMTVHRTTSTELSQDVLSAKKMLPVCLHFSAKAGEFATIIAKSGAVEASVQSDFVVQNAQNTPTTAEEIAIQLHKTGDTCFTITNIVVDCDNIFIPKSQLNALRRTALARIENSLLEDHATKHLHKAAVSLPVFPTVTTTYAPVKNTVAVICKTKQQLNDAAKSGIDLLIYKPQFINSETICDAAQFGAYVDIPPFTNTKYLQSLISDCKTKPVCHNVAHVQLARELNIAYIAGQGLNIFNDQIADMFSDADTFVYSYELSLKEIYAFKRQDGLIFVDGDLPLMKFSHCPFKASTGCDCSTCKAGGELVYTDESGRAFKIVRRKDEKCTFELINGNKLSALGKLAQGGRYLLDYDKAVIAHYLAINNGKSDELTCNQPYTRGRLYNKIN